MIIKKRGLEYTTKINFILFAGFSLLLCIILFSEPRLTGYLASGQTEPMELASCNQLSLQGGKYYLKNDINVENYYSNKCFRILNENIELDCRGFKIKGTRQNEIAIAVESSGSGAIIKNCILELKDPSIGQLVQPSARYGVFINRASNIQIKNITFNESFAGILINESLGRVIIENNLFSSNYDSTGTEYAIFNINTNNTKILNNIFLTKNSALFVISSAYLIATNNTFRNVGSYVVFADSLANSNFSLNKIENSTNGIKFLRSSFNLLSNNTFLRTQNADIELSSNSKNNTLKDNRFSQNTPNIILIDESSTGNIITPLYYSQTPEREVSGSLIFVDNCTLLDKPNTLYKLNDSFEIPEQIPTCIQITADNVILDGDENVIYSSDTSLNGITARGIKNITIKNIEIENCNNSIIFNNVTLSTIEGTSFYENNKGVLLLNSKQNKIALNKIYDNLEDGIFLENSTLNLIEENLIEYNSRYGIALIKSSNNTITQNIFLENGENVHEELSTNNITDNYDFESLPKDPNFQISEAQLSQGVSIMIGINEKIRFLMGFLQYNLTLKQILYPSATFSITPSSTEFNLIKGETKKIDLNKNQLIDLEIKLENLTPTNAKVFLKKVNEQNSQDYQNMEEDLGDELEDEENRAETKDLPLKNINVTYKSQEKTSKQNTALTIFTILLVGAIVIVLAILITLILVSKNSQKNVSMQAQS